MRVLLFVLAIYFLLTSFYIWFAPHTFYEMTPGVSLMGPFNLHFIRDVALSFFVSGGAMLFGALKTNKAALICGAAWPLLHALFHVSIWVHRGFPLDHIWAVDMSAVIIPGLLAMVISVRFKTS